MEELKKRLRREAVVTENGIILVDMFLNHQVDVGFLERMGQEVADRFKGTGIDRVLTAEASGIPMACFVARALRVPMVFAKKHHSGHVETAEIYQAEVFSTRRRITYSLQVSASYLPDSDRVLVVDDFLSAGMQTLALLEILEKADCSCAGVAVAIEKAFQDGGRLLREMGVRVEPLCVVEAIEDGNLLIL